MVSSSINDITYKSKEYYRSITSIEVLHLKVLDCSKDLAYKKGDKIVKKRFLRKPLITRANEDLYKLYHYTDESCDLLTAVTYARYFNLKYNKEQNFFYRPAKVYLKKGKDTETFSFDSDEEANNFVEDLIDKCKKSGNELL